MAAAVAAAGAAAGLLAAFRWAPDWRWPCLSCDADLARAGGVQALLARASPGRWGVSPGPAEPELPAAAVCDPPLGALLESLTRNGLSATWDAVAEAFCRRYSRDGAT